MVLEPDGGGVVVVVVVVVVVLVAGDEMWSECGSNLKSFNG